MAENKGFVIWFTGLSGAGKTTLSQALAEKLRVYRKTTVADLDPQLVLEALQ